MEKTMTTDELVQEYINQANILANVAEERKWFATIQGHKYLNVEAWQFILSLNQMDCVIEWSKPLNQKGDKLQGWEARAVVFQDGREVSAGEEHCLRQERNWQKRDDFQIRSMAQTRAISKAARNKFGFLAKLAGYEATPIAEMDTEYHVPASMEQQVEIDDLLNKLGKKPEELESILPRLLSTAETTLATLAEQDANRVIHFLQSKLEKQSEKEGQDE